MGKKQSRSSPKKPLVISVPAKKAVEEVASTLKKPVEVVASTSKKKKQPVINTPPESHTDDKEMETEEEEEEEEDEEIDSSAEEEDEPKKPVKIPSASASAPAVAATVIQSSGSESGSDTENGESDSETEPPLPRPPASVTSPKTTLRKRLSQVTASPDGNATTTKRAKTETEETGNTAKKGLFQRVWSEEDEIALLADMLTFKNKTGNNPSNDFAASYETVKESNYLEGKSYSQFSSKVTCLRTKYLKKNKTRTNVHDLKCLELCKKIWGNVLVKSKKMMKVEDHSVRGDGVSDWFEKSNLVADLTSLGVVEEVAIMEKWSLVSVKMKKKLEEKWMLLQAGDFERLKLRSELVYLVSSAITNAN